jgi:ribosomal protein S18 acetylase RimI-like enzyme
MDEILLKLNPLVTNDELNALFVAAWEQHSDSDFQAILKHSRIYVCAYVESRLAGFVKVVWDGGVHGFLLDTTVHPDFQRRGIGVLLVQKAAEAAREQGIEWLHVDYETHLAEFYRQCGFRHTEAGLMNLKNLVR